MPGDSPEAVVSRMSAAVGSGDLATALDERGKLPEAGACRLGGLGGSGSDRVAIDRLVGKLAASLEASPASE